MLNIEVIGPLDGRLTDLELLQKLEARGIEKYDANIILIFLPIAFCRRMLPNFRWVDKFYIVKQTDEAFVERKFSSDFVYGLIWQEVLAFFSYHHNKEVVLKISGRSSEFHAINDLLNAGGRLEDIKLTPINVVI